MKTLADLEAIRKRTLDNLNTRKDEHSTRVVVGMATRGIARRARAWSWPPLSTRLPSATFIT